ncbi:MAG: AAA family ATPase [Peptococcaceae bacterium]|jgi:hypothetical protein|nr:AAA family ATPase [Peptococcaceae bacterium]
MTSRLFPLGRPVPREDLVGRQDFMKNLHNPLSEGQSVMLAGPRRVGKTSLAMEILRQFQEKNYDTAYFDLFRYNTKRALAVAIIDACAHIRDGTGESVRADSCTSSLRAEMNSEERDGDALLIESFQLPERIAREGGRRLVFVFDETQEIIRLAGKPTLQTIQERFQHHTSASYLFLGSPFATVGTSLPMPPIAVGSWQKYITQKFNSKDIAASERLVLEILTLSGGYPQDTMLLCTEIYSAVLEEGASALSMEYVRVGYERTQTAMAIIFDEVLNHLGKTPVNRQVLVQLAKNQRLYAGRQHNPNEIKRAVDTLVTRMIIDKTDRGSYRFLEPMFKHYLIHRLA